MKKKIPVSKNWFATALSRGTISSEHSNSKVVEMGSRTHVLGDICFMNFNSFFGDSNPHKGVKEK